MKTTMMYANLDYLQIFLIKMEKAIPELVFSHITIKRTKIAAPPIKGHFRLIVSLMK